LFEKYLIEHCSPTLAGLKTANLFSYPIKNIIKLYNDLNKWNEELNHKGIKLEIIRLNNNTALIYVYRKEKLKKDLSSYEIIKFLKEYGYTEQSYIYAINRLKERLIKSNKFPHEIGVFLGYPIDDVKEFIKNAGQNSKCSGCWKVYCNECEAIKIFKKFNKCKKIYSMLFSNGRPISKLTVNI